MTMPVQELKVVVTVVTPFVKGSDMIRFKSISVPEQQLAMQTPTLLPFEQRSFTQAQVGIST